MARKRPDMRKGGWRELAAVLATAVALPLFDEVRA
jgi:hypothetical protein